MRCETTNKVPCNATYCEQKDLSNDRAKTIDITIQTEHRIKARDNTL